ncbi:MAG: tetratricopeptide repeat protein [Nitrospira sp.]|nr:tetratricopeptide repeat protein [Nitrospira sp.]
MPESSGPQSSPSDLAAEAYERGLALRKAGLFKPSIEQFEKAASDPALALKAYAHIGLSQKSCDRYEDAVTAFHNALKSPGASTKDIVQILYVLGRTLESLGRIAEALEAYRWLRREDSLYRDVGERIDALSRGRSHAEQRSAQNNPSTGTWQNLLRNVK